MNLDQMLYLVELSKTNTISQAAKNLNISQAGLSQSLDSLENELDVKLFNRTRHGTTITQAGEQMVLHAKEIENQLGLIRQVAEQQKHEVTPPLQMGVMNEVPGSLLDWLLEFQDQHPTFKASLREANNRQIVKNVENGEFDVGLIAINRSNFQWLRNVQFKQIGKGTFKLYMTPNHYLAKHPDPIPVELICEQDFALFTDDYIEDFADHISAKYGALNVIVQSTSFRVIYESMRKFQAVSIIRDSQINNRLYQTGLETDALIEHDLSGLGLTDDQQFQYGLVWLPGKQFTDLQEAFINGVRI
ncbi:LysR family transcriptional regulator [Secundilactobacillus folii]|nr:LysR family transcriptional regulator [Secundilactobacillus folii]